MKRKTILVLTAVIGFVLALGIALYPMVSSIYNEQHQSKIHTQFLQQVEDTDDSKLQEALERARAYNASLAGVVTDNAFSEDAILGAYVDASIGQDVESFYEWLKEIPPSTEETVPGETLTPETVTHHPELLGAMQKYNRNKFFHKNPP